MPKGTDLTKTGEYAAAMLSGPELQALVRQNLGGSALDPLDLDRVQVPSGGGLAWTLPTLEGPTPVPEIVGVVVYDHFFRSYYRERYGAGGGNKPPDCLSEDDHTGIGDPGGECAICPMAEFGSATDERGDEAAGQACRLKRRMFLARPGSILPLVIILPTMSIARGTPIKKYTLRLLDACIPMRSVVTAFGLEQTKNRGGITYSRATARMVRRLSESEERAMASYAEAIKGVISTTRLSEDDLATETAPIG